MEWERRGVLRRVAALAGVGLGGATGFTVGSAPATAVESEPGHAVERRRGGPTDRARQRVDADLPAGVTLFDLDGDGEYAVTVERAGAAVRDDDHPRPVHATSGGRSTVDYALAAVEPPAGTTLGGLGELSYDYRGSAGVTASAATGGGTTTDGGTATGESDPGDGSAAGPTPGEVFVVVETGDGRHGAYCSVDAAPGAGGEWRTVDVLARLRGEGGDAGGGDDAVGGGNEGDAGDGRWYEYTGDNRESFDDALARFGPDARLRRVGVGVGDAVEPTAVDAYYGGPMIDGTARRFPVEVVNRVSRGAR